MTLAIALGMLGVANTGNDLLQVLDVIQQDSESAAANTGEGDMQWVSDTYCGPLLDYTMALCGPR